MLGLAEEVHTAIAEAVKGLRGCGYSWAEIGSRLGITRQAASNDGAHPDQPREIDQQSRALCPLRRHSAVGGPQSG